MELSANRINSSGPIVLSLHIGVIVLLVFVGMVPSCRDKNLQAISVNLVSLPTPSPVSPAPAPPSPQPAPPEPTPPPAPADPPEPIPTPAPPEEPSPAPVPRPRLRSVEDIRRTATLDPPVRTTPPRPRRRTVSPNDVAQRLHSSVRNVAATYTPTPSASISRASANRYLGVISAILRSKWRQPSTAELGGRRPVTGVALKIARDGRVISAQISSRSGNSGMDSSVQILLNGLARLPAPSSYGIDAATFSVDIAFEVD